jgi:hypothetical protein
MSPLPGATQGHDYGLCFSSGAFHVVIHNTKIVKLFALDNFRARPCQSSRDFFVGVLPPASQTILKSLS